MASGEKVVNLAAEVRSGCGLSRARELEVWLAHGHNSWDGHCRSLLLLLFFQILDGAFCRAFKVQR